MSVLGLTIGYYNLRSNEIIDMHLISGGPGNLAQVLTL